MAKANKYGRLLLLSFAALAVTAAMLAGCSGERKEHLAQKLLEEKYRERFSVSVNENQELGSGHYTAKAYSVQYPDMPFSVSVDNNGKNFSDNYVARRVCSKIEEQVYSNIHAANGKLFVHVEVMVPGHGLNDPDMTVSDFVSVNPDNRFSLYIFSASTERLAGNLQNILSSLENLPGGTIYIYSTPESTVAEMQKYCKETGTPVSEHIKLKDDCVYVEIPFAHGKILGRCQ